MKLSTKKNRFPHTFSKARALECNYSVNVTRPCPASSGSRRECGCGCQIFISTPQRTVALSGQPWLLYEGGSKFCQALPHRGPGSGLEG